MQQNNLRAKVLLRDRKKCLVSGANIKVYNVYGVSQQEGEEGVASHIVPVSSIEQREAPEEILQLFDGNPYHCLSAILLRKDWDKALDKFLIYIDVTTILQSIIIKENGHLLALFLKVLIQVHDLLFQKNRTDFPPNEVFNWHKNHAISTRQTFAKNPPTNT